MLSFYLISSIKIINMLCVVYHFKINYYTLQNDNISIGYKCKAQYTPLHTIFLHINKTVKILYFNPYTDFICSLNLDDKYKYKLSNGDIF